MRNKRVSRPVYVYLNNQFPIRREEIDSVFGFTEYTSLYGGRIYTGPQLSDDDIAHLHLNHVGFRIPLTNHYVDEEEYERESWYLEKYHDDLNTVICVNDQLAEWIRRDFPKYSIEASVIKNLDSLKKIDKALTLYDSVVPPMHLNDDEEFLKSLPKDQTRLFANAFCAYTCPQKVCYPSISKINKGQDVPFECSMGKKYREFEGMHDFDLDYLKSLGFTKFKLLRHRNGLAEPSHH